MGACEEVACRLLQELSRLAVSDIARESVWRAVEAGVIVEETGDDEVRGIVADAVRMHCVPVEPFLRVARLRSWPARVERLRLPEAGAAEPPEGEEEEEEVVQAEEEGLARGTGKREAEHDEGARAEKRRRVEAADGAEEKEEKEEKEEQALPAWMEQDAGMAERAARRPWEELQRTKARAIGVASEQVRALEADAKGGRMRVREVTEAALRWLAGRGLPIGALAYLYVVRACLEAEDVDAARRVLTEALERGLLHRGRLWEFMQVPFLRRLIRAGIVDASEDPALLPPTSDGFALCAAAAIASLGDQEGSKHGAALTAADGTLLALGFNHRYPPFPALVERALPATGVPSRSSAPPGPPLAAPALAPTGLGDGWRGPWEDLPQWSAARDRAAAERQLGEKLVLRKRASPAALVAAGFTHAEVPRIQNMQRKVMHSEIHCLQQLPDLELARGAACLVVEIGNDDVAYEEAVPCRMCSKAVGLVRLARVLHTAHDGIHSYAPRPAAPDTVCEALDAARG